MAEIYDGVIYGDYSKYTRLRINYTVSQNETTAVSTITMNLYAERTKGSEQYNNSGQAYWNLTGKGNTSMKFSWAASSLEMHLGSSSTTVQHNPDGTGSVTLSGYWYTGRTGSSYIPEAISISKNITLKTIPRASSVSGGSGNIGGTTTISVSRASTSFTHTLRYVFGSLSGTIATGVGTSYNWTLPTSFYAQVPNAKSKTGTIYCDTYNGSTLIGTKSTTFTATVTEASSRPTVTATLTDTNATTKALTGNASKMVKGKSTGQLVITSSVKNSATIKSVTVNGTNVGTAASITKTYANISTASFTIVTTDSRGFTNTSYVVTPSYVNYVPLTLSATIFRPQPTGTEVQMTYSGNYFNASFGSVANTLSITWKYKVKGASSWTNGGTIKPTLSGNTISSKTISLGTSYNYQTAYEFQITAVDKLTNSVQTMSLSVGLPVFDWGKEFLRVNKKLLLKDSPPNFGGCRADTVSGSYVRLFTYTMTSNYKNTSIWFTLCDTQATNENLLCNLYARRGSATAGVSVTNFRYISTPTSGFVTSRLVAVVTSLSTIEVYFKMNTYDSPAISILSMTRALEDNDSFGKITIDCSTTTTTLPSGTATNPNGISINAKTLTAAGHIGWTNQTDGDSHLVTKAAIAFWNGAYDSNNTSNLKYCAEGPIQAKPTTLYSNADGTTGTVTLSQSAANFAYLEIFFNDNEYGYFDSVKVSSPNGKIALLDWGMNFSASGTRRTFSRRVKINGTSIANAHGNEDDYGAWDSWNDLVSKTNKIRIVKVVGYK